MRPRRGDRRRTGPGARHPGAARTVHERRHRAARPRFPRPLTHLYAKLGVTDRAAAVATGYERGILGTGRAGV
ncbi:hypothetical protein GA0115257_12394 [Streptomyces sp. LcepLS]|nr:hypothetical protein GA0115251_128613 [Streptomyces sp. TverLS-915]SCF50091.1 hypothetical protein GA0115257_12394 [Streptomyces sp. LcepLS]